MRPHSTLCRAPNPAELSIRADGIVAHAPCSLRLDCRRALPTKYGVATHPCVMQGDEAAAFNPLSKGNGAVDLETTVQKPLHTFLAAWIDAACSFQEAVVPPDSSDGGFNASPTLTLTLPKATVITLEGAGLPPATFLLTFLAAGSGYKQFKFTRSSAEQAVRAKPVAFSAPLQFPVSNPIMCVRSWAREIFWQPPPHARAAVLAAEPGLVPRGKGWLDKELARALEVAMPYLALRSQHFWKDGTVPAPGGILVSGGRGSGKSALLERCAAFLGSHPMTMCHVSRMSCRSMAGDKMKRVRPPPLRAGPHSPSSCMRNARTASTALAGRLAAVQLLSGAWSTVSACRHRLLP